MTGFPVTVGLDYGQEKRTSSDKEMTLGTRGVLPDGRVFYYTQCGATGIGGGLVVQTKVSHGGSAHVAALDVVGGGTTGVTTLTVTVATTPATRDQYADGYLSIDTSPGHGLHRIKSHGPIDSAANGEFTLWDNDPLREALTSGTTKVGLQENPYASVIVSPTTRTGIAVGVTPVDVAADEFFWAQTYGPAQVHSDEAPVAGEAVVLPGASAGKVDVGATVAEDIPSQIIGYAKTVGAGDEKMNFIFLTIRS